MKPLWHPISYKMTILDSALSYHSHARQSIPTRKPVIKGGFQVIAQTTHSHVLTKGFDHATTRSNIWNFYFKNCL